MFGNEGPCARHFATDGSTLQHAQDDEQDGSRHADGCIGRHQRHAQRRERHQQDGEGKDALAAVTVAIMRQHDAAQRTDQITGGKDAESLDHHQPVRHFRREEQVADDGGEKYENDEVVKFQRAAEGRKAKSFVILTVEGPGCRRCGGGRHEAASFLNYVLLMGMRQAGRDFKPNRRSIAQVFRGSIKKAAQETDVFQLVIKALGDAVCVEIVNRGLWNGQ